MAPRLRHVDIQIRGVVYPTARAAGEALGVRPHRVLEALRDGNLDEVGLRRAHPKPMPIRVRGKLYPSPTDASLALKVTVKAVYSALQRGTLDRLGLKRRYNGARARAIVLGGLSFPSGAAAERALGLSKGYIAVARAKGSDFMWGNVMAAALRLQAARERAARQEREAA